VIFVFLNKHAINVPDGTVYYDYKIKLIDQSFVLSFKR